MIKHLLQDLAAVLILAVIATPTIAQDIAPKAGTLNAKLTQNRQLSGVPIELASLNVTTSFGDVKIPMDKVNGIKFHANQDDSAVIAFKNGDLVTGKIDLKKLSIKTEWGKAHINISQLDAITVSSSAAFFKDGTNGKGWRFSDGSSANNP